MYLNIIMLLSLVLAGLSIVSVVKNFLVNLNVSDNGWKTVLVTILVVICLLGALFSFSEAYVARDIRFSLSLPQAPNVDINELKQQISVMTVSGTVCICVGYIAYLFHMILIKQIRESKLKQIELNAGNRWAGKI